MSNSVHLITIQPFYLVIQNIYFSSILPATNYPDLRFLEHMSLIQKAIWIPSVNIKTRIEKHDTEKILFQALGTFAPRVHEECESLF